MDGKKSRISYSPGCRLYEQPDALIRKVQKETNKRVYYLELTQEAARLYQIYNKGQYHAIDTVQKQYSKDEIAVFCRVLNSLNDSYCKELQHEYQTD